MPCSTLVQGGVLSCLNLTYQALFTLHGRPYPFRGLDGGGLVRDKVHAEGVGVREGE